jgi:hypothetical protein
MQTKKQSAREVMIDTAIGFVLAIIVNWAIVRALEDTNHGLTAIVLTGACTVLSLVRKYIVRRFFNERDG